MDTTWIILFSILTTFTGFVTLQTIPTETLTALEGGSVILPCEDSSAVGTLCMWTSAYGPSAISGPVQVDGENILLVAPNKVVPGELINQPGQGRCSLKLNVVPLEAEGEYTCRIRKTNGDYYVKMNKLQVGTLPLPPQIFYNGQPIDDGHPHLLSIDAVNTIECRVGRGIPKAELSWEDGLNHENVENPDGSVVSFVRLTTNDFADRPPEKRITCVAKQAHFQNGEARATAIVGLPYAPTIVKAQLANGIQNVGKDGVMLYCNANGIPAPEYQWMKKPQREGEMEIFVSRDQNFTAMESAVYNCYARNSMSSNWSGSSDSIILSGEEARVTGETANVQDAGAIIGIVVGTLVLIVLIALIILFSYRRKVLCFRERSRDPPAVSQSAAENGTSHLNPLNSPEYNEKDGKGDQNENKPTELVYAQLDLTQSQGNNTKLNTKPAEEKTEYAQIKFQPKENQV